MAFDLPDFRQIIVPARINGRDARVLIDSGAGTFVIDRKLAQTLGASGSGSFVAIGADSAATGDRLESLTVQFGPLGFATKGAAIFDLSASQAAGSGFDAIIGRDLFANLIVDVDFADRRIMFSAPGATTPKAQPIPVARSDFGLWSMPVALGGREIPALIDLGADRPLTVSPALASQVGLLAHRRVTTTATAGVGGMQVGQLVSLNGLRVGGAHFTAVPTEIPQAWNYTAPAIVGLPVLRRFRLTTDFPAGSLYLAAAKIDEPFRKDRSGIGAQRKGDALQVMHVAALSPAARAGLRAGDLIVAINGERLSQDYFRAHPRLGAGPAGTTFALRLADGSGISITLEDYF